MSNEIVKSFNEILDSFLIQIAPLVGTSYHYKFELISKANSRLAIEQFLIYALPLREKILNRDETYFSNNNNHKDTVGENENIIGEILRLQDIYLKLDEISRSNVWDIFQAMLILGEDYIRANTKKYV